MNREAPRVSLGRRWLQPAFYAVFEILFQILWRVLFRARGTGAERVPAKGPVLLIANHQSYLDPALIGMFITQRQLHYIARRGLFKVRGLGCIIRWLNGIPIPEDGNALSSMRKILDRLEQGHAVLIFPEGSRTPDGAMHRFKAGASAIIKRAQCPVAPVAIEGCFDVWPRTARRPRFRHGGIAVMYGEPIDHAELMREGRDGATRRLEREIDAMRLTLRRELRARFGEAFPAAGGGDGALVDSAQDHIDDSSLSE